VERNRFKQRLVGGLVLVALGAIVIPFLLDVHQGSEWWGTGNIPKKPDDGFVTRVLPLDERAKQAQTDMAEGAKQLGTVPEHAPAAAAPQSPQVTSPPPTAPAQPDKAAVAPTPGTTPASVAAHKKGWVVQLASFSNQKNADDLVTKLRGQGYRVFVERVAAQGGQAVYRVRVGPEGQRTAAEGVRDKLAHELHLKAMVLPLP